MRDIVKRFYRDIWTGVLLTVSIALTFFMVLNFIRIKNIMNSEITGASYVEQLYANIECNTENGTIDGDVDFLEALSTNDGNVSICMGAEIDGATSYSHLVQFVVSYNEEFTQDVKEGKILNNRNCNGSVVISEQMLQYSKEKNGEKYMSIAGKEYLVAAIIKDVGVSGMDGTIIAFVNGISGKDRENLNARINNSQLNVTVQIGSNNVKVMDIYKEIAECFVENDMSLNICDGVEKSETELFSQAMNNIIQPIVLVFCFVNIFVITGMWVRKRLYECAVRKGFGAKHSMLMLHLLVEMGKCIIAAFVLGVITQLAYLRATNKTFVLEQYATSDGVKILVMALVIMVITLFLQGETVKRTEPVTVMRKL